jgi:hypothetical protein
MMKITTLAEMAKGRMPPRGFRGAMVVCVVFWERLVLAVLEEEEDDWGSCWKLMPMVEFNPTISTPDVGLAVHPMGGLTVNR